MARIDTLQNFLTDIADKFRTKLGTTSEIIHSEYDTKIDEVYDKGYAKGVSIGGGTERPPEYDGEYVVTPKVNEQTMGTKDKVMTDDVTIKAIPFFNVGNASGGDTVYIGSEV